MDKANCSFRYAPAWVLMLSLFSPVVAGAEQVSAAGRDLKMAVGHSRIDAGERLKITESLDARLAKDLGQQLGMPVSAYRADDHTPLARLKAGSVDAVLAALPAEISVPAEWEKINTGYAVAPMAIMRSDTDIKTWTQLKGRTVCLAAQGRYAGMTARQYGAKEIRFDLISDALLGVRTGQCDAAVHDDVVLNRLLTLPEWKKFSAHLTADSTVPLMLVFPKKDAAANKYAKVAEQWRAGRNNDLRLNSLVNQIAFDIYLKQDVPDCH